MQRVCVLISTAVVIPDESLDFSLDFTVDHFSLFKVYAQTLDESFFHVMQQHWLFKVLSDLAPVI